MPIDKSKGQVTKKEYVAQVTDLRSVVDVFENRKTGEMEEIPRIYVDLSDVDPNMLTRFPLRFRDSQDRRASWMKWLTGIELLGVPCKEDPNVITKKFIHVREEPEANEIDGDMVEWIFPRVVEITASEERAKEIYESLPKVAVTIGLDAKTKQDILGVYKSLKTLPNAEKMFKDAIGPTLPEGVTPDMAWDMAKKETEEEIEF